VPRSWPTGDHEVGEGGLTLSVAACIPLPYAETAVSDTTVSSSCITSTYRWSGDAGNSGSASQGVASGHSERGQSPRLMPVHPFALGPLRPLAVCWILFAGRALIPILDVISVAVARIACGELVLLRPAGENYVHNLLTPAVPVRFPSSPTDTRTSPTCGPRPMTTAVRSPTTGSTTPPSGCSSSWLLTRMLSC